MPWESHVANMNEKRENEGMNKVRIPWNNLYLSPKTTEDSDSGLLEILRNSHLFVQSKLQIF